MSGLLEKAGFTFASEQKNALMVGPPVAGDAGLTDSSLAHWELGPVFSGLCGLCVVACVHA